MGEILGQESETTQACAVGARSAGALCDDRVLEAAIGGRRAAEPACATMRERRPARRTETEDD
jgi:hypothetical protein